MTPSSTVRPWVGIGAQRSGTTWFTDLLLQHPRVALAGKGKELHRFDSTLVRPLAPGRVRRYRRSLTPYDGTSPGEYTPAYLRMPWAASQAAEICPPEALFLVMLRDPVDRFYSGLRWALGRRESESFTFQELTRWARGQGSNAVWAGMYATQLETWVREVGRQRIFVMQYEAVVADPIKYLNQVALLLGVGPFAASVEDKRSRTSTVESEFITRDQRVVELLKGVYGREVRQLTAQWDIDPELWPSFQS